jgi:hypothetical protein
MTDPRVAPPFAAIVPVNILYISRSGRLVRVGAEFRSIGLANRFELVSLDEPGVTIYGWGASLVRMLAHGPFRGLVRSVSQERKIESN